MIDQQFKAKGFLVWGICALFFLYDFAIRTVTGTYQQAIMHDLSLTTFQFSLLSTTLFAIVYGVMQIPAGIIVNSVGLKKTLVFASLICAISSFGFSFSNGYIEALLYRLLMGLGTSFGFICVLVSINDWMPHRFSAIFIGLSQFIGTIGPMLDAGPLGALSRSMEIGWRFIFLGFCGVAVVLMFTIAFFVENNHQQTGQYIILRRPEKISNSILRLFSKIQPWYIALLSGCLYFTVEYFSENEGQAFLSLKGLSLNSASYMITAAWVGYAIGCPSLGFLSDFFQRRKIFLSICSLLGLASIVVILYLPIKSVLLLAFFFLGVSAGGQTIGLAIMAEQYKRKFVAVGFGLNNAMVAGISAFGSGVIGFLLDLTKKGDEIILHEYLSIFNVLIVLFVVAVVLAFFFVKETYCKNVADYTYLDLKKR